MIFNAFKTDIKSFSTRDLIKFSRELDSAKLPSDSIIKSYIINDAHFFIGIIELNCIVKQELANRLECKLPPTEEIS